MREIKDVGVDGYIAVLALGGGACEIPTIQEAKKFIPEDIFRIGRGLLGALTQEEKEQSLAGGGASQQQSISEGSALWTVDSKSPECGV